MSKDIYFNNPNFDPKKFDPVHLKIPPKWTTEEYINVVNAGIGKLKFKIPEPADVDRLINKAKDRIKPVRHKAEVYEMGCRADGKDVDHAHLFQMLLQGLLEAFEDFDREDLGFVLAFFLSQVIKGEIV